MRGFLCDYNIFQTILMGNIFVCIKIKQLCIVCAVSTPIIKDGNTLKGLLKPTKIKQLEFLATFTNFYSLF